MEFESKPAFYMWTEFGICIELSINQET